VIGTRIFWSAAYTDPTDLSNEHPRGPVAPPVVYQEDNTLTFVADHPIQTRMLIWVQRWKLKIEKMNQVIH
jgi:hypothetical protein